jgi:hypothetical protein
MTRTCTVCQHPERQAIDKALVDPATPYRIIAAQWAISTQALQRHKADHLLAEIVAAWQQERAANGQELAGELRGWMDALTKLLRACDEWLTDPHDPSRYDLAPRAHEVWCHYETGGGTGEGRPVRKKERLSALLARLETAGLREPYSFVMVEQKSADPRKLIIDTSKALEGHLRLLGEIVGKLQTQGTANFLITPEWGEMRGRMLAALAQYPSAKLALAEVLEAEYAEGR